MTSQTDSRRFRRERGGSKTPPQRAAGQVGKDEAAVFVRRRQHSHHAAGENKRQAQSPGMHRNPRRETMNEFQATLTEALDISAFEGHARLAPGTYMVTLLRNARRAAD